MAQEIALKGSELVALVDDEDFERASKYSWYLTDLGYVVGGSGEARRVMLHRFVMNAPKGTELDHINRNKLDCRKENLRFCTRSENCRNRPVRSDNKFGISGISFFYGRFHAYIGTPPNRTFRRFKTLEEAKAWRIAEAKKRFGEFHPHQEFDDEAGLLANEPNAVR